MTRSTCIGYLSLPQLTGDEGRELLDLLDRWISRHDRMHGPVVDKVRPVRAAIGIYYIRETDDGKDVTS